VNQNWGTTGVAPMRPPADSSFEVTAKILGISPAQFRNSVQLREWARENRRRKYIPPDLLISWGFAVEDES